MSANCYDPVTTTDSTTLADDDWGLNLPNIRYGSFGPSRFKSFGDFLRERARLLFIIGCILVLGTVLISSIAMATRTSSGREPSHKVETRFTRLGGLSQRKDADSEVQALIEKLKSDVETQYGKEFSKFTAVSYRTQQVSGTNYFVKIAVGDEKYIHIRVFCDLPYLNKAPELAGAQSDMTKEDALDYF